jgi:hypothetical protein
MANLVPLNSFKTTPVTATDQLSTIYTTPVGVSSVILMAQFTNISSNTGNVSAYYCKANINYELASGMEIPQNDAATVLTGRLVLEQGDSFKIKSGANNTFKFIMSYLETANA